ncbi:MAG: CRISPR-associated endonuclease Cas2 [candidate division WOR-3 bacterium]|nr:CRISPR-associated endonuclease Cas2 [candidate division WOR-3 bacterium]
MFIVVSYDISDDRRRRTVFNILKDHGNHVQFSVFECNLDSDQLRRMHQRIQSVINMNEDNVRFYILCATCKEKIMVEGNGNITEETEVYIF